MTGKEVPSKTHKRVREVRSSLLNDTSVPSQSAKIEWGKSDHLYGMEPHEGYKKIDCPVEGCIWSSHFGDDIGRMMSFKLYNRHVDAKHPQIAVLMYKKKGP